MNPSFSIPVSDLKSILIFVSCSFLIAFLFSPILTDFLYKNRIGKHLRPKMGIDGASAPIFTEMHGSKQGTPVMGGLLFWVTAAILTVFFNLNRQETWLPLFAMVVAGVIGAIDDILNAYGRGHNGSGIRFAYRLLIFTAVAVAGAWWFHYKLEWDNLFVPILNQTVAIGWWYVPLFIGTTIYTAFSINQTDGLDGLAGGVCSFAFFVFIFIALVQGKLHLAIFCATLVGALLGFLWFNINPARFFMGDTGSMALGMTLPIVAFLTNSALLLPLILFVPFVEGLSTIIQIVSKKLFHRKVFRVAPIHHHFEAIGWSEPKVTMRFWLIAALGSSLGLLLMLARL